MLNSKKADRLKRLLYRSSHRGCKETDLVMGSFAEKNLSTLSEQELNTFEALLEEQDWDVWNWLTGKEIPAAKYQPLIEMMKAYTAPAL